MKTISLSSRKVMLRLLDVTYLLVRPLLGPRGVCRFTPTCSQYAKLAISKYGIWKGSFLAVRRLSKCHPLHAGGYDPVP
ncbi:MAG: membrane protein insertion efficiency factor YidD [Elusimicrobiaceae bacterium]|nr:membrane protein insertion efficiency factor YidD [Elusimicrobiaceae bacterium]